MHTEKTEKTAKEANRERIYSETRKSGASSTQ